MIVVGCGQRGRLNLCQCLRKMTWKRCQRSESISYKNNQLHVEDIGCQSLVERFGSPLYVYSKSQLVNNWQQFQRHWPSPHKLCYAVKANSNLAVLQVLAHQGAGFDIVSGGELQRVLGRR